MSEKSLFKFKTAFEAATQPLATLAKTRNLYVEFSPEQPREQGRSAAEFVDVVANSPIAEADRHYRWPLGRRPKGHPSLSDLGL